MKIVALFITAVASTVFSAAAAPDELSLRDSLKARGADYCYRFSSWNENSKAARFMVTLYFFQSAPERGAYQGYAGGFPQADKAIIEIERTTQKKIVRRVQQLDAKAASELICSIGYSGFFSADSIDPYVAYLDGHGLKGERLYSGEYHSKTCSYEERLSCRWLYDYLENFSKKGELKTR